MRRVVVVNDGSTDGTRKTLDALAERHGFVTPLHSPKNEGISRAIRRAYVGAAAFARRYNYPPERVVVVRMDADGEHRPEDLPKLIEPVVSGGAWSAVGHLTHPVRRVGVTDWLFHKIYGSLEGLRVLGTRLKQHSPGFQAHRLDALGGMLPAFRAHRHAYRDRNAEPMKWATDLAVLAAAHRTHGSVAVVDVAPGGARSRRSLSRILEQARAVHKHFRALKGWKAAPRSRWSRSR